MLRSNNDIPTFAIRVNTLIDRSNLYNSLYSAMKAMLPDQSEGYLRRCAKAVEANAYNFRDWHPSSSVYVSFRGGLPRVEGRTTALPTMNIARFKKLFGGKQ